LLLLVLCNTFQGAHCILPENRQLVDSLKRRNIHPLIICIIPNSAKTIMWVQLQ